MTELEKARREIDLADKEIARAFERRMRAAAAVAAYKKENGLPVFDPAREQALIERNGALIPDEALRSYYIRMLKTMMTLSKDYQHLLLEGRRVAYSGVPGAFAYIAATRIFPDGIPAAYPSFKDAYEAVESGACDCAVLPIENSFSGDVDTVIDLTFFGSLYVAGVYDLEIEQNLLGNPGATRETIRTVTSHPQALSQCAGYLERRGYETLEAANTAIAAQSVRKSDRSDLGAIASRETAELYGLEVLEAKINEASNNTTRFAVFSRAQNKISPEDDQFILFFTVKNEAGALGRVISVIGEKGFNLKTLKSRPTRDSLWEYYFFVEGNGNIYGEKGKELIAAISPVCSGIRIAGSFKKERKL